MKKIFILSFISIITFGLQAQSKYTVEIFTADYENLENSIELSTPGDDWDDPEFVIPIGFTADILGNEADSLYMARSVGGVLSTSDDDYFTPGTQFYFYASDLMDRATGGGPYSPISYEISGDLGSQIFKFELKDAGFLNELTYSYNVESFVNIQFWLYESDNSWEIRIGPTNVVDPSVIFDYSIGPIVGYGTFGDSNFLGSYLLNDSNDPPTLDSFIVDPFAIEVPAENTVIRFSEIIVGSKSPKTITGIELFPSLAADQIFLTIENQELVQSGADVKIYDINGTSYYRNSIEEVGTLEVPVSHLAAGQYYITVQGKEGFKTMPFIKQ